MKQNSKLNAIVVAMMAISHNRVDYLAGTVFEAPQKDVVFLKMAKYVREPTADELKAYEERQTLATATATEPDANDHAGLEAKPSSDNEDAAEAPQPETETVELEVVELEVVELEPVIEDAPKTEPEVIEPETTEPAVVTNPYDGWLKKDLNAELDNRGIEHDATARNDELEALLNVDDAKQANA